MKASRIIAIGAFDLAVVVGTYLLACVLASGFSGLVPALRHFLYSLTFATGLIPIAIYGRWRGYVPTDRPSLSIVPVLICILAASIILDAGFPSDYTLILYAGTLAIGLAAGSQIDRRRAITLDG